MRPRPSALRRITLALAAVAAVLVAAGLPISGAVFVATTANLDNQASTVVIEPPTDVAVDLNFRLLPPNCSATISWVASTTPTVTSYEVERISKATATVVAGPWIVTGTSMVENDLPLLLSGAPWEWRVRSIDGDFRSDWVTASADAALLCA